MKYFSLLLFTLFILFTQPLSAQKLVVDSFIEAQGDITASAQATQRLDNNGDACALIKVYLPTPGAQFRGNLVGNADFKVNQYWVYLTKGSKTLGIDVAGYFPLDIRFEDYGILGVQTKTTYILLIMPDGNVQVADSLTQTINVVEEQTPASKEEENVVQEEEKPAQEEEKKEVPVMVQEPVKDTLEVIMPIAENQKQKTSSVGFRNPPSFYIGANYQLGGLQGIGLNIGTYIKQINVELNFIKGLGESDPLFLSNGTNNSNSYVYSAMSIGLRGGYGILASKRFRITPQLGFNYVQVSGSVDSKSGSGSTKDIDTYGLNLTLGAKADFDITRNFGLSICPEYAIPMSQGGIYKSLSDSDSTVKGFASGFNFRIGAYVCF